MAGLAARKDRLGYTLGRFVSIHMLCHVSTAYIRMVIHSPEIFTCLTLAGFGGRLYSVSALFILEVQKPLSMTSLSSLLTPTSREYSGHPRLCQTVCLSVCLSAR